MSINMNQYMHEDLFDTDSEEFIDETDLVKDPIVETKTRKDVAFRWSDPDYLRDESVMLEYAVGDLTVSVPHTLTVDNINESLESLKMDPLLAGTINDLSTPKSSHKSKGIDLEVTVNMKTMIAEVKEYTQSVEKLVASLEKLKTSFDAVNQAFTVNAISGPNNPLRMMRPLNYPSSLTLLGDHTAPIRYSIPNTLIVHPHMMNDLHSVLTESLKEEAAMDEADDAAFTGIDVKLKSLGLLRPTPAEADDPEDDDEYMLSDWWTGMTAKPL